MNLFRYKLSSTIGEVQTLPFPQTRTSYLDHAAEIPQPNPTHSQRTSPPTIQWMEDNTDNKNVKKKALSFFIVRYLSMMFMILPECCCLIQHSTGQWSWANQHRHGNVEPDGHSICHSQYQLQYCTLWI